MSYHTRVWYKDFETQYKSRQHTTTQLKISYHFIVNFFYCINIAK